MLEPVVVTWHSLCAGEGDILGGRPVMSSCTEFGGLHACQNTTKTHR